jgi:hypothetical protein
MTEPYDITGPADRAQGLRRYVDRMGREWTEPSPMLCLTCPACGYQGGLVEFRFSPKLEFTCPRCGRADVLPLDDEDAEPDDAEDRS